MKSILSFLLCLIGSIGFAQNLSKRIIHNDPSTYRELDNVHAGAGKMGFTQLIGRNDLATNFLYLHSGVIQPKSGIGHHFHHTIEEMYVILDGEAEFTVNGRTSKIKGPALVPCKLGDSHGIYNTSGKPLKWLNFAVSLEKGQGDAFDLADDRVGAKMDHTPVFVSSSLDKNLLKSDDANNKENGILSKRVLGPEVFKTDWHHVDYITIPSGKSTQKDTLEGVEEVYYVINGNGSVTVGSESVTIKKDDSFHVGLGEDVSWSTSGNENLELLVIGIAASKKSGRAISKPLEQPKAMALQMDFVVDIKNAAAFEKMYYSIYLPAMVVQEGYLSSKLLRLFPKDLSKEIQAEPTTFNYQIQIVFNTEENRRKWVASDQHQIAWPAASGLAKEFKWRGYDVMGDDVQD
ncbi:Mannose-6-phosphate isomerase, cupin superfamily [Pricia antarctica]|uniref:Mannose-6-phosphate isomerase, cupin superfamily n=1 Tax=Pricia antarctica TaxID=641691 RepID=A0A1G7HST0_9FLAO|nr:cupin domain-containing protein [Pricia antarctica]SDF03492.1 Mannose-6-phosphate isomerase, cupin superfamily [Pricia antarctica]